MKNIQDILKKLASPIGESPYSVTGVARKRYILGEVVIENVLQSQVGIVNNDLSDIDKINLDKVIDAYNKSNNGYKSRTINNGNAIVDSGVVYEPNTIDKATYVKTNILNGGVQGVYEGNENYNFGFENGNTSNRGLYTTRTVLSTGGGVESINYTEELYPHLINTQNGTDVFFDNGQNLSVVFHEVPINISILFSNAALPNAFNLEYLESITNASFIKDVFNCAEGNFTYRAVNTTSYFKLTHVETGDSFILDYRPKPINNNQTIFLISNYVTSSVEKDLKVIKGLYPLLSQAAKDKINGSVVAYCYSIENMLNMLEVNINTIEFVLEDGTKVTQNNLAGVNITNERRRFLTLVKSVKTKINREYTKYFEGFKPAVVTAPQNIVVNEVVTTSELFKENTIDVELSDADFDIGNPNTSNFVYNAKLSPSPSGSKNVTIPKEGANVFMNKTSNEDYYIVGATDYDTVDVKVDNNLEMYIKDYLINLKSDKLLMYVNKPYTNVDGDNYIGVKVEYNELKTNGLTYIELGTNNNSIILQNEKYINIDGGSTKIGIGIKGDDHFTTPYDNNILQLSEIKNDVYFALKSLQQCFETSLNSNFEYLVYENGNIKKVDVNTIVSYCINLRAADISQDERYVQSFIETFNTVWSSVEAMKRTLRIELDRATTVRNSTYGGEVYNPLNYQALSTEYEALKSVVKNDVLSDLFIQLILIKYKENARNITNTDFNFYKFFMTKIKTSNMKDEIESLILRSNWNYGKEDGKYVNTVFGYAVGTKYLSQVDATNITATYLCIKYVLVCSSIEYLISKRNAYVRQPSDYSESIGLLLQDFINFTIGGLSSYMLNQSATGNVLQPIISVETYDNSMELILERTKKLLK